VQLLDCHKDLGKVKYRVTHRHAHLLLNLVEEFPTRQVLEEKVQIFFVLHRFQEVDKEAALRVVTPGLAPVELRGNVTHDVALVLYVLDMLGTSNALFLDLLQRK